MPSLELNADEVILRKNSLIEWARKEFKHNRVPSLGRAIKKFKWLNKTKFYKLFPRGIAELWREAGYRKKGDTPTTFTTSKAVQTEPIHVSAKETYEESIRLSQEALEELSYEARVDPEKAWEFAKKVLPLVDEDLWIRFNRMSNGNPQRAFRHALALAGGTYRDKIMREAARGKSPDDSDEQFLTWNQELLRNWLQIMISRKRARSLPPQIVSGNCRTCKSNAYLTTKGSIKCGTCGDIPSWACGMCGSERTIPDDIYQISCQDCGNRGFLLPVLLEPNLQQVRREEIMESLRDEFGDVVDKGGYTIVKDGIPEIPVSFQSLADRMLKDESSWKGFQSQRRVKVVTQPRA